MSLIQRIDALLPQTQCGKCGHPGCRPYAEGLARGEAINKCPPGGEETIVQLAALLNVPVIGLDTERGTALAQVAFIREAECIGCTKCIQACPVDAIVGAAKLMHTVIIDECTGCDLCVAPCPVDCIEMRPLPIVAVSPNGGLALTRAQHQVRTEKRNSARRRFEARNARLRREEGQRIAERLARADRPSSSSLPSAKQGQPASDGSAPLPMDDDTAMKQARIAVVMSRTQLDRSLKAFGHPPVREQAARLVELQREFQLAEMALEILSIKSRDEPVLITVKQDKASLNRAKIQLAMRRAALKKAVAADAPPDQLAVLKAAVDDATKLLIQLDTQPTVSTPI